MNAASRAVQYGASDEADTVNGPDVGRGTHATAPGTGTVSGSTNEAGAGTIYVSVPGPINGTSAGPINGNAPLRGAGSTAQATPGDATDAAYAAGGGLRGQRDGADNLGRGGPVGGGAVVVPVAAGAALAVAAGLAWQGDSGMDGESECPPAALCALESAASRCWPCRSHGATQFRRRGHHSATRVMSQ
jgi:hypothetical protein